MLSWEKDANGNSIIWEGEGLDEVGIRYDSKKVVIRVSKRYFRPTEVEELKGDSTKALNELEAQISLEELIKEMIEVDLRNKKINIQQ